MWETVEAIIIWTIVILLCGFVTIMILPDGLSDGAMAFWMFVFPWAFPVGLYHLVPFLMDVMPTMFGQYGIIPRWINDNKVYLILTFIVSLPLLFLFQVPGILFLFIAQGLFSIPFIQDAYNYMYDLSDFLGFIFICLFTPFLLFVSAAIAVKTCEILEDKFDISLSLSNLGSFSMNRRSGVSDRRACSCTDRRR